MLQVRGRAGGFVLVQALTAAGQSLRTRSASRGLQVVLLIVIGGNPDAGDEGHELVKKTNGGLAVAKRPGHRKCDKLRGDVLLGTPRN